MARLPVNEATDGQIEGLTKAGFTKDEIEGMTPDERDALLDQDDDTGITATADQDGNDPDEVVKEPDAKGFADVTDKTGMPHAEEEIEATIEAKKEPKVEAAKPVIEDKPAEVVAEVESPEPTKRDYVPKMRVPEARDYGAELKSIDDKLDAAEAKWSEGEISNADMTRVRREARNAEREIIAAQTEARVSTKYNNEAAETLWEMQQADFLDQHPEYRFEKSPILYNTLSETLKLYGEEWQKAGLTNRQALNKAHELIQKEFGKAEVKVPVKEPVKAPAARKPDLKSVPVTLAHTPSAADIETDGNSEFDNLDSLEGLEFERALARLPEDKQNAYLKRVA